VKQVNTHEAKNHLLRLLDEVAAGGEIVIAKAGHPLARLVPYVAASNPRTLGLLKGRVTESPDCWAPDENLAASVESPLYAPGTSESTMKVAEEP